jgi:putative transposase
MKNELVIATGNPHKVKELRAIFAERGIEVVGLGDLGMEIREPEETGTTFEENAAIKALSYAEQTGRRCLADDSGLEVDALGGAPGVISSHYSSDGVETGLSRAQRDAANNARLMREMENVPREGRAARFVCVMCVAGLGGIGGIGVPPVHPSTLLSTGPDLEKSERTLPHWEIGGRTYFVTFRVLNRELSESERERVLSSCLYWHGTRMRLHVGVVMPDHVHLLITPLPDPSGGWFSLARLMHSIKSYSSHEIGKAGGGGQLWQAEAYDRVVRTYGEFKEKRHYIWLDPVRAGLVAEPRQYRFLAVPPWTRAQSDRAQQVLKLRDSSEAYRRDAYTTNTFRTLTARGTFEGRIGMAGEVPRGGNGFGYDPLFVVEDGRTSAELNEGEKNARSHRGVAARAMAEKLRGWR